MTIVAAVAADMEVAVGEEEVEDTVGVSYQTQDHVGTF